MKFKSLKNLVFTLILVLPFSTLAFASTTGTQINKNVNNIKSSLTFANEKVNTGSNEFTLSLLDKNGKSLPNANLKVSAAMNNSTDMTGMSGMTTENKPMMIVLKEGSKKGEYTGTIDFKSTGKWVVKSTFNAGGQTKNIDLNVAVVKKTGPNFLIIGFAGVMLLIIVVAAINKKKSKKA